MTQTNLQNISEPNSRYSVSGLGLDQVDQSNRELRAGSPVIALGEQREVYAKSTASPSSIREGHVARQFDKLDRNGDGVITRDEFLQGFNTLS